MAKIKNILVVAFASVFVLGFSLLSIFMPDNEVSQSERRKLEKFPEITVDSLLSGEFMSKFEAYTVDQFPFRDSFRTVKALVSYYAMGQKDNNGFYISNGYIVKMDYPMDTDSITYATGRFKYIYDTYLKGKNVNVYSTLIPDKNFLVSDDKGYLAMDYNEFAKFVKDEMDYAKYIDIFPLLELSDYYATDTHWRQEKITDVAKYIAKNMGVELTESYTEKMIEEPFYGVYYGQAAVSVEPDKLYYLDSDIFKNCTVKDMETQSLIDMYDMEKLTSDHASKIADPYEMFLSGPNRAIVEIENPTATTDRELIVFRDSYANAIAPLFAEGYKKITLIDLRRTVPEYLGNFVEFNNADVLFLQSTLVLNSSSEIR